MKIKTASFIIPSLLKGLYATMLFTPLAHATPNHPPHPRDYSGDWCRAYLRSHSTKSIWLGKYAAQGMNTFNDHYRTVSVEACFSTEKSCKQWLYVTRSGTSWHFSPEREFFAICRKHS